MRIARAFARATMAVGLVAACEPIVAESSVSAPRNDCNESACDRYEQTSARPTCAGEGRCEVAGNPEYPYVLSVSVPEGSFYSPGRTFLVRSQDFRGDQVECFAPECFVLPHLVDVVGAYRMRSEVAGQVGFPYGAATLPARVAYFPELVLDDGSRRDAADLGLPSFPIFGSALTSGQGGFGYQTLVPFGPHRREVIPTTPFDGAFPPLVSSTNVGITGYSNLDSDGQKPYYEDVFEVGSAPAALDDPSGEAHTANVKRTAGLDGFVAYLRDRGNGRRLSSLRALGGAEAAVRLDTLGQNAENGALRDGIEIVVAPDPRWVGVPTLVDRILAGAGFRLDYPDLPAPIAVTGQIDAAGATPGAIVFVSTRLDVLTATTSDVVYRTTVQTDGEGRFATVLPPGNYEAYVEPSEASFGKTRLSVSVSATDRTLVLRTVRKGNVSGKVRIADGRALANAEVVWAPASARRAVEPWSAPRPGRTMTDAEGRYSLPLDSGDYDVTVIPRPGSGFPRFVAPRRPIGPDDSTLDDFVVFAPTRVSLTMKSPDRQPITRAIVRAFAYVASGGTFVEVGQTMSDTAGAFELLLGPLPK